MRNAYHALRGGDPGNPSSMILTWRNRLAVKIMFCTLTIAFAIFGSASLRREQVKFNQILAEQNQINLQLAEIEKAEKSTNYGRSVGQQKSQGIRNTVDETARKVRVARTGDFVRGRSAFSLDDPFEYRSDILSEGVQTASDDQNLSVLLPRTISDRSGISPISHGAFHLR